MADFLASSWPVILVCVAVGYVLGRVRPIFYWFATNDQLRATGRLRRRDRRL